VGWTYEQATPSNGPGSKADNLVWQKQGVFVLQSGMDNTRTYNAMQAQSGDDSWYRTHFTIYLSGEVLQHYFPTVALVSVPPTDGQSFIWIGLAGSRDASPPSDQWNSFILLLRWLYGVVIPTAGISAEVNLRGNLLGGY